MGETNDRLIEELHMALLNPAPCVRSGFCCKKGPCGYGEKINDHNPQCRFLEREKEIASGVWQHRCGRYEWIKANVPGWEYHPAFGAGCSSTLFNEERSAVIAVLRARGEEVREHALEILHPFFEKASHPGYDAPTPKEEGDDADQA